ncbi:hydrogenase expression/formation protein HypE [Candidatus Aciduliprofundum boonei]|uniref:Hydrogenase expression/formation protein HypE n=1 Tax=Aciduliprofundum boonei (strain DSM 19572 / T469) TaxID=439481 RepID=D3TD56_ACIB4|nr:hydrogenase expression/formation protein HypE [Candidatus Aciduliprofundum boonei]ADD08491.1 hydrogenase expression/formation protein HypE [Aciduliprofundum boonei T469]
MKLDRIRMVDGAGGEAMERLIKEIILDNITLRSAGKVSLDDLDDGATISLDGEDIVFTIDGHTVKPIFFPGGDIGKLAVSGTVNDLAVMGAKPLALAISLIIEDGFSMDSLKNIMISIDKTGKDVPVPIITGDTKVVEDKIGIFAISAGIGKADKIVRDSGARVGDFVLINGGIGEHGFAIMSKREGIDFETSLVSDVSPLWSLIEDVAKCIGWENIHAMKDPTRGGLSEALNEMASKANVGIEIDEESVPIKSSVKAASEMLGISPFIMANEGKVVMIVADGYQDDAIEAMRKNKNGKDAAIIGRVIREYPGKVIIKTKIGGKRFIERPIGDPVPRVC